MTPRRKKSTVVEEAPPAEEATAEAPIAAEPEEKVKANLEHRIQNMDMAHKVFGVVVPQVDEIEIRDGQRRTVPRKIFPGYVLVEMIMDEESWYVVRNTPGVTGVVGSAHEPTPLEEG